MSFYIRNKALELTLLHCEEGQSSLRPLAYDRCITAVLINGNGAR